MKFDAKQKQYPVEIKECKNRYVALLFEKSLHFRVSRAFQTS